jgi:SAM-dependent methyltransferase
MLEDTIISLLAKSPADQYSLYRQIGGTTRMSQLLKAISVLQQSRVIHVAKYRKSVRTGLEVPIYSLSKGGKTSNGNTNNNRSTNSNIKRLDVHDLLAGVTSERLVEYEFVARNLMSSQKQAAILDIGSGNSILAEAISKFGKGKWAVFRVDIEKSNCDIRMDARMTGFRKAVFDQVICISTIEHIGIGTDYTGYYDDDGDIKTIKEIVRVLKKGGNAIITVPYGKVMKLTHRVYDRHALSRLLDVDTGSLVEARKEFYCYKAGKWKRCSQGTADRMIADDAQAPLHFHSMTCACILLRKR